VRTDQEPNAYSEALDSLEAGAHLAARLAAYDQRLVFHLRWGRFWKCERCGVPRQHFDGEACSGKARPVGYTAPPKEAVTVLAALLDRELLRKLRSNGLKKDSSQT
jgi:hypothetical protein